MAKSIWQRLEAATGLIYVLLSVISLSMIPLPPATGTAVSDLVAYYKVYNGLRYLIPCYMQQFALLFLLCFVGYLCGILRRAEGETTHLSTIVLGAGVSAATILLTFGAIAPTLPVRTDDPTIIRALSDLEGIGAITYFLPAAVMVAAASIIILHTAAIARWIGVLGLLIAVVQLLGSLSMVIPSGPFAPASLFSILAYIGFMIWILAASILLVMKVGSVGQHAKSIPATIV